MATAPPHMSQFTQTLMLFVGSSFTLSSTPPVHLVIQSQTQGGRRYTPHLTRFYAAVPPSELLTRIVAAMDLLGVKHKDAPHSDVHVSDDAEEEAGEASDRALRLRVGGLDARREAFKGWVEFEPYAHRREDGGVGTFCVLRREVVSKRDMRVLIIRKLMADDRETPSPGVSCGRRS
jgi:serine/threonine-protein kinase Chk1